MRALSDAALMAAAEAVRLRAHAPYSRFLVGAAIEDEQGVLHLGCNVENGAYPLGSCAEAGAIAAMCAGGGARIVRIAVAGGRGELEACTPCGGCRQRIAEFADGETQILLREADGALRSHRLAELLPFSFSLRGEPAPRAV